MTDRQIQRALGRAWQSEYPWEFLTRLTGIENRMGGHSGEHRAADLVADAFERAGARTVTTDSFEMQRWDRDRVDFGLTDPVERSFEAIALPYSPSGDVRGELVDVGHGTPEEIDAADVDGKVAVASTTTPSGTRFVHRMEKFGHAAAAGAEAFVFRNHLSGQLPPTGSLGFDGRAAVPGVGVSEETGAWLTEYAREGATARLSVDATTELGVSHNVHAVIGPEEAERASDEEVVVVAHYDAHDVGEGALDNGCGIAVVVTAAHLLAQLDLDATVRVAGVGCEEIGLMGSEALADRLDLDDVRAVVNVDGAGRFRNVRAFTHGSAAMESLVEDVFERANQPVSVVEQVHPFSDHWPFLRRGVPALQLHSEPDSRRASVASTGRTARGRGWGHTRADTRDKVDDRNLREHAVLTALLVRELASTGEVPRPEASEIAADLRENDYEEGMRAVDIWPEEWE